MPSRIDGSKYYHWRGRYIATGSLRAFDLMTRHYEAGNFADYAPPVGKRRREAIPHTPVVHTNCENIYCMFCEGGLFACSVCGAFEGATTTDCPGISVDYDSLNAVYAGDLDYIVSKGWVHSDSRMGRYAKIKEEVWPNLARFGKGTINVDLPGGTL